MRVVFAVVTAFVCTSACGNDPCPSGRVEQLVNVGPEGIAVQPYSGYAEYTPYSEPSPVAHCSIVDAILMFPGGKLRSDDFASAEEIGSIGGDVPIGEYVQDLLEGFDQVTRLSSIGVYFAEVSGFNNVTTMGVLGTGGLITGFNSLESAAAIPYTGNTPGLTHLKHLGEFKPSTGLTALELPALEEVEGDLFLELTRIPRFSLPSLTSVGGNLRIVGNSYIQSWGCHIF
jgi:hypothetical protein